MGLIVDGLLKAFQLIFSLDREVLGITLLSLQVSGLATLISLFLGISWCSLCLMFSILPAFIGVHRRFQLVLDSL